MVTLVVGLGNPILGDDGIGWRVVEEAARRWEKSPEQAEVEFDTVALGGLTLMERLIGYDRAVLVDAVMSGAPPGTVRRFDLDELPTRHADSAHDASLAAALALGQRLGARLPVQIRVVGVAIEPVYDFSDHLTAAVAASMSTAVDAVLTELSTHAAIPRVCATGGHDDIARAAASLSVFSRTEG